MTLDDKLLSRLNSQLGRFRNYACHDLLIDYMKALPPEVWRYVTYNDLKRKFERRKTMVDYGTKIKFDDPNREELVREAYEFMGTHIDATVVDDNIFVTVERRPPEEIKTMLEKETANYMNRAVAVKDYANIESACSYATSTNPIYKEEGEQANDFRDACWQAYYDIVVNSEELPASVEEYLNQLPVLGWNNAEPN